jgi:hypothetical protein
MLFVRKNLGYEGISVLNVKEFPTRFFSSVKLRKYTVNFFLSARGEGTIDGGFLLFSQTAN